MSVSVFMVEVPRMPSGLCQSLVVAQPVELPCVCIVIGESGTVMQDIVAYQSLTGLQGGPVNKGRVRTQ